MASRLDGALAIIWANAGTLCQEHIWHIWPKQNKAVHTMYMLYTWGFMIMSSNGNIFRVTGLCDRAQTPVMRNFDVFFDLRMDKSKQSQGW